MPRQHRVHPAGQRAGNGRRRSAGRLRCRLSRSGPRRRLSRRPGRDARRSAPPAGHDQVQPGADLDAAQRRRHRRRLYVHLRDGGTGRLSAVRAHHPGLEHVAADRLRSPTASRGCCASSTRSDSSRSRPTNWREWRRDFPLGRRDIRIEPKTYSASRTTAPSSPSTPPASPTSQAKRQAAFDAERAEWERARRVLAASPRWPRRVAGGAEPVARPAAGLRSGRDAVRRQRVADHRRASGTRSRRGRWWRSWKR